MNYESSRLTRLIAIMTQLLTKRHIIATKLASEFSVSVRTIYRDIRTLEAAGVPILTEEGKGYSLMKGYKLPPVMFTEHEANALITAVQLVRVSNDTSFKDNYTNAVAKVNAILRDSDQEKAKLLSERVGFRVGNDQKIPTSNLLASIENALLHFQVVTIEYVAAGQSERSVRDVEPFAVINQVGESWYLIAWCRTRKDFRLFRFDRIARFDITDKTFVKHDITLEAFLSSYRKKNFGDP